MVMDRGWHSLAPSLGGRLDKTFELLHSEVPHLSEAVGISATISGGPAAMEDSGAGASIGLEVIEVGRRDKLLFAT